MGPTDVMTFLCNLWCMKKWGYGYSLFFDLNSSVLWKLFCFSDSSEFLVLCCYVLLLYCCQVSGVQLACARSGGTAATWQVQWYAGRPAQYRTAHLWHASVELPRRLSADFPPALLWDLCSAQLAWSPCRQFAVTGCKAGGANVPVRVHKVQGEFSINQSIKIYMAPFQDPYSEASSGVLWQINFVAVL